MKITQSEGCATTEWKSPRNGEDISADAPPGHTAWRNEDSELVEFSPQHECAAPFHVRKQLVAPSRCKNRQAGLWAAKAPPIMTMFTG